MSPVVTDHKNIFLHPWIWISQLTVDTASSNVCYSIQSAHIATTSYLFEDECGLNHKVRIDWWFERFVGFLWLSTPYHDGILRIFESCAPTTSYLLGINLSMWLVFTVIEWFVNLSGLIGFLWLSKPGHRQFGCVLCCRFIPLGIDLVSVTGGLWTGACCHGKDWWFERFVDFYDRSGGLLANSNACLPLNTFLGIHLLMWIIYSGFVFAVLEYLAMFAPIPFYTFFDENIVDMNHIGGPFHGMILSIRTLWSNFSGCRHQCSFDGWMLS